MSLSDIPSACAPPRAQGKDGFVSALFFCSCIKSVEDINFVEFISSTSLLFLYCCRSACRFACRFACHFVCRFACRSFVAVSEILFVAPTARTLKISPIYYGYDGKFVCRFGRDFVCR